MPVSVGGIDTTRTIVGIIEEYHDVPLADAAANAQMNEVIGNKADTNAGTSLFAQSVIALEQLVVIDEFHDVPAQNAAANAQINEVIGNKTDTTAGTSLVSLVKIVDAVVDEIPGETNAKTFNATALAAVRAEVRGELDTAYPAAPTANTPNDGLISAGGKFVIHAGVQLTGNGASTENIFQVTGYIRILQLYAICSAKVDTTTFSNVKFAIYDGTNTVNLTAVVDASTAAAGDLLVKVAPAATALSWLNSDAGGIYVEGPATAQAFYEGIVVQKPAANTYIQLCYTGDATTDVTWAFYLRWVPLISTSTAVAV